jgi:putative ABC transport system ATP-binding protein
MQINQSSKHSLFNLQGVTLRRGSHTVLDDLDVAIADQAFTCLIGPSGSGKTSLLRLLNRLDEPSHGRILFRGQPIDQIPVQQLRRQIGFVAQSPVMFDGSVANNLELAQRLAGRAHQSIDFKQLIKSVELSADFLERTAATLSGGEKQRVALARALVTAPEVLLLDEPTAALDLVVARRLIELLRRLQDVHRLSMVMVTHRPEESKAAATHVVMLAAGRTVEPTSSISEGLRSAGLASTPGSENSAT